MRPLALFFVFALSAVTLGCADRNVAIEIPENYQGWIVVHFSAQDCGRDEKDGFFQSVVEIQANGEGCSTQWEGIGNYTLLSFYYVDSTGQRTRELSDTGWGEGGELWGLAGRSDKQVIYFFVGPEASYQLNSSPPRNL